MIKSGILAPITLKAIIRGLLKNIKAKINANIVCPLYEDKKSP